MINVTRREAYKTKMDMIGDSKGEEKNMVHREKRNKRAGQLTDIQKEEQTQVKKEENRQYLQKRVSL